MGQRGRPIAVHIAATRKDLCTFGDQLIDQRLWPQLRDLVEMLTEVATDLANAAFYGQIMEENRPDR